VALVVVRQASVVAQVEIILRRAEEEIARIVNCF